MTPTPSAPPTWRAVLFVAAPTPVWSSGSEPITDSVDGAKASPVPTPSSMKAGRASR